MVRTQMDLTRKDDAQGPEVGVPKTMSGAIRQFGAQEPNADYIARPGVYAVIAAEQSRLAVVMLASGACHLPGGGIDPQESELDALVREVREECGLTVRVLGHIGRANQYGYSDVAGCHFNKLCSYYATEVAPGDNTQRRGQDEWVWLSAQEAVRRLDHASHAWAVARYFGLPFDRSAWGAR